MICNKAIYILLSRAGRPQHELAQVKDLSQGWSDIGPNLAGSILQYIPQSALSAQQVGACVRAWPSILWHNDEPWMLMSNTTFHKAVLAVPLAALRHAEVCDRMSDALLSSVTKRVPDLVLSRAQTCERLSNAQFLKALSCCNVKALTDTYPHIQNRLEAVRSQSPKTRRRPIHELKTPNRSLRL